MTQTTLEQQSSSLSGTTSTPAASAASSIRPEEIDKLVRNAVFGEENDREMARWHIWEAAQSAGVRPASIHDLYIARGEGRAPGGYTVPAINIRGMAYDTARSLFRTAK